MASSSSSPLQGLHSTLISSFSSPNPDLSSIGTQLTKLKIALTQRGLLAPRLDDASSLNKDELVLARDVLEVGAFWSIRVKDVKGFKRYMDLLRGFYTDLAPHLPPSSNHEPLLGLSLLHLLSTNAIASFPLVLETLPANLISTSPYLQHPVHLERCLMEGSYSKVWRSRTNVPREEYRFFVDELMGTIRGEIASCEERAYKSLPLRDAATLLFFESMAEVSAFANERGWEINPSTQTVHFHPSSHQQQSTLAAPGAGAATAALGANKAAPPAPSTSTGGAGGGGADAFVVDDEEARRLGPKRAMIASNLQFARELESIV